MLRIINTNRPIILFFLPVYTILLFVPFFWNQPIPGPKNYMPLYQLFNGVFSHLIVQKIVTVAIILAGAYSINFTVNKHNLLFKNTNITATVYVLLAAIFSTYFGMHPILFANVILIWVFDAALTLYNQNKVYNYCFRVGFLIGLASLFYINSLFILLEFFAALLIIRTFDWRDWVITLTGLLVPFFYAWTYYFWTDQLPYFFDGIASMWESHNTIIKSARWKLIFYGFLAVLAIWATFIKVTKENVRQKNLLYLLIIYTALALLVKFTMNTSWIGGILLSLPGVVVMAAILLQSVTRKWISEVLIWIVLIAALSNYWQLLT